LPGARLTPQTVLASALEKHESIDSVVVIIKWKDKDESTVADWSLQKKSDLAIAGQVLQHVIHEALYPNE
jgi:hypothetical protein